VSIRINSGVGVGVEGGTFHKKLNYFGGLYSNSSLIELILNIN
jgi:hypothetical protein